MRDMTETQRSLRGVHNFLPTPLCPDCRPDLDGMRDNVAYHARAGPEDMTVTVCGGFGEGLALDAEEHRDVVAAAVAGAAGKVPIAAVASAETAYTYLRGLAESVDLPVVVFVVGEQEFWPGVLERLAPNIVGVSPPGGPETADRVGRTVQSMVPDRFVWINENEESAIRSFAHGCDGYTTAVASIVPRASREFWRAGVSGDTGPGTPGTGGRTHTPARHAGQRL